jgi:CheY-like chemotaxis protein
LRRSQEFLVMAYLDTMGFSTSFFDSEDAFLEQEQAYDMVMVFYDSGLCRSREYTNRAGKFILLTGILDDYSLFEPDEVVHFPLYGSKLFAVIDEHLRHRVHKERKNLYANGASRYHSHVLVVEDNQVNQKLIKAILNKMGCEVTLAANGLEAITAFRNGQFAMVFMDINMPVMDGCDATREILQIEKAKNMPHTPIIALTANIQKGDRERFLSIGMDDYIPKPITLQMVESTMGRFIALTPQDEKVPEPLTIPSDNTLDLASALSGLGVGEAMMLELIEEFLDNYRSARSQLDDAVKFGNTEIARHLAHKYKGASGNLRMTNLYNYFKALEQTVADKTKSKTLLAQIDSEMETIAQRITR